jgi:hypothetical protein
VRSLPPAAPGMPPLQATADAMDGCWWTPFYSEKLGLEMAVQKCENGKFAFTPVETATAFKVGPERPEKAHRCVYGRNLAGRCFHGNGARAAVHR